MKKKKRVLSFLLAIAMVLSLIPGSALSASAKEPEKPVKVVVSVEGQTLSQGFYIEPTIVTFDEFITYWSGKGQTVTPENITAGGVLSYALQKNGTPMANEETVSGPSYLATVKGIDKGNASLPQFLADAGVTLDTTEPAENNDLSEKYYTSAAGWMYTEGNIMSNQALGGHKFYTYGTSYTQNGETWYVVRLQYTVAGLGADLGFSRYSTYDYSYEAADKGQLYILYARLSDDGFFAQFPDEREEALEVMNKLNATQTEVDNAYNALLKASLAEEPEFTENLDETSVYYDINASAAALEVEASVTRGSLTYEWFESDDKQTWNSLGTAGADNKSYTPSTAQAGTKYYKCVVTNYDDATGLSNSAESNIATINTGALTPVFETNLNEEEQRYICTDTAETLIVSASTSDEGILSYQWYVSEDKEEWTVLTGQTTENYTPDVSTIGTRYYKCTVTNTCGESQSSCDSQTATITVAVDMPAFAENLRTSTSYPSFDEELTLSVQAQVQDNGNITYQWYRSEQYASDITGMTAIEGAVDSSYTVDTTKAGAYYYRVVATNTVQGQTAAAVSNWTRVEVSAEEPVFDTNLSSEASYLLGDTYEALTVSASVTDGGEISYQWYWSDTNPWGSIYYMTSIEGATEATYTPDISSNGTFYYACQATNTNRGDVVTADSKIIKITVRACQQPVITKNLDSSAFYVAGDENPAPLEIEASVDDGGTLSYQWYQTEGYAWSVDSMTAIDGATGSTYVPDITKDGVTYACRVTNSTDKGSEYIDSNMIRVTVSCAVPEITKDLSAETVTYNKNDEAEALSIEASVSDGGELSYQWYRSVDGGSMVAIEGAVGTSCIPDTSILGTSCYQVKVTNTRSGVSNSTDSQIISITVLAPLEYISTEEELRAMDPNGNYVLKNDIELTSNWEPLAKFSGTLDGDGHIISGLVIEGNDYNGIGFFKKTGSGAVIKNLGLIGTVTQTGYGNTGGLVGVTAGDGLTVSNCYLDVEVNGNQYYHVGGLIGQMQNKGVIENCYFTGSLTGGTDWAYNGGLVGVTYNNGAVIRNSYTTHNKAIGNYAQYDAEQTVNNYCASEDDAHASMIPEDMDEFLSVLDPNEEAFAKDSENINDGYPILLWQVKQVVSPEDPDEPADSSFDENIYITTGDYLEGLVKDYTPTVSSVGGEWMVLGLLRSGREIPDGYYENVVNYVKENINDKEQLHRSKSTDNSRVILALTAAGYDVTDVAGHNLLKGLTDMSYLEKQGINGPIWALIALDSHNYEIPQADEGADQVTRQKLISAILNAQLEDGGWSIIDSSLNSDVDVTAMAIQALAPYYESDETVEAAVDKALDFLSANQKEDGGFGSVDGSSSESCAQVLVALTALGINPDTDSRFVKNGSSVVDALNSFYTEGGGFKHAADGERDGMATEQGYYALAAYWRMLNEKTSLYDMSDVTIRSTEVINPGNSYEVEVIVPSVPDSAVDKVTVGVSEDAKNTVDQTMSEIINKISSGNEKPSGIDEITAENIKNAIEAGKDISVQVVVNEIASTDEIGEAVKNCILAIVSEEDGQIVQYLDLSVVIKNDSGEKLGNITELKAPITVVVAIPENMRAEGRTFFIIRYHNGVAEKLETTDNGDGTVSFKTDRFSTYALAYTDDNSANPEDPGKQNQTETDKTQSNNSDKTQSNNSDKTQVKGTAKTGDESPTWMLFMAVVVACGGLAGGLTYRRKNRF